MGPIKLHKLILQPGIVNLLESAAGRIQIPFKIEDAQKNILLKNQPDSAAPGDQVFEIKVGDRTLGTVTGSEEARIIADLVSALARAEFDKKALAGEALHRYKELALLYGFTDQVSAKLNVKETARLIIDEARRMIPGDNFSVMVLASDSRLLTIAAATGNENPIKLAMKSGDGFAGDVFASGKAEILNNVQEDPRFLKGAGNIHSMMCVPLKARQKVIGVLNISSATPHEYTSEDLKLAIAVGLVGAGAIGNARYTQELRTHRDHLEDTVAERTRELEKTMLELKRTNKFLEHISMADPLTGIGNRRSFDQLLDSEWRRSSREGQPLSLVLLDLDYFKAYNDTYGHQAGDRCLVEIVNCMRSSLQRPTDSIARYGGEEFAVVLGNTDAENARDITRTLLESIELLGIPHRGSGICDWVTASAGVAAVIPNKQTTVVELIKSADRALYAAKQGGRNRLEVA